MMLNSNVADSLSTQYGVYIFYKKKIPIYIGKAVNIKARIKSHFANATLDPKELLIIKNSDSIKSIETISDFEAILLEAKLIKKYEPKYNVIWKDDKSSLYIKITSKEKYPKIFLVRRENDRKSIYFGPLGSAKLARDLLSEVRRVIPFCTQKKVYGGACFYSKIGLCSPCPNLIVKAADETLKSIYRKNIRQIINLLSGGQNKVLKSLKLELKKAISEDDFEKGLTVRDRMNRLHELIFYRSFRSANQDNFSNKHPISEISAFMYKYNLVPGGRFISPSVRVECFDISNLFGKYATASMVVFEDGMPAKGEYRKFKIKTVKKISDIEMLQEVFRRRFSRKDWGMPDLLVVDGGRGQVAAVKKILVQTGTDIPLLGIAKNPDRLVLKDMLSASPKEAPKGAVMNFFRHIRDESHRFAKKYHVFLRGKKFQT